MTKRKKPSKPAMCPAAQAINALPEADRRAVIQDLDALIARLTERMKGQAKP
jgi:hypothetical protein